MISAPSTFWSPPLASTRWSSAPPGSRSYVSTASIRLAGAAGAPVVLPSVFHLPINTSRRSKAASVSGAIRVSFVSLAGADARQRQRAEFWHDAAPPSVPPFARPSKPCAASPRNGAGPYPCDHHRMTGASHACRRSRRRSPHEPHPSRSRLRSPPAAPGVPSDVLRVQEPHPSVGGADAPPRRDRRASTLRDLQDAHASRRGVAAGLSGRAVMPRYMSLWLRSRARGSFSGRARSDAPHAAGGAPGWALDEPVATEIPGCRGCPETHPRAHRLSQSPRHGS
jgi:hypothetical protein